MLLPLFALLSAVPLLTLAAGLVALWALRRRAGRLRPAWLLGVLLLSMGVDAPEEEPSWFDPGAAPPAHHTIEAGLGVGSYQTCSGPHRYGQVGAMYRYTAPLGPHTAFTAAGGGYGAVDDDALAGAARGAVGLEHRWVGGEVGLIVGRLHHEAPLETPILPAASLRIGPRDIVFVDASVMDQSPGPLPGPFVEAGMGVALPSLGNAWEPFRLRAGISGAGFYLAPSFPVGEAANVELVGAYGDSHTWAATARVRLHRGD